MTAKYDALPLDATKHKGRLLHQLQIMRNGTTGHLDDVNGSVKRDYGGLGGQGDGWEERPYWLDGAGPFNLEESLIFQHLFG